MRRLWLVAAALLGAALAAPNGALATALGADPERAREALARLGLGDKLERHPRDLSSGERERLALAQR